MGEFWIGAMDGITAMLYLVSALYWIIHTRTLYLRRRAFA